MHPLLQPSFVYFAIAVNYLLLAWMHLP